MRLYRIFDALGDSIILLTYFQKYDIKTVYYNRGKFERLTLLSNYLNISLPNFVKVNEKIETDMIDVLVQLTKDNINLISFNNNAEKGDYQTTQVGSKWTASSDRNITKEETQEYLTHALVKDVSIATTIGDIIKLLSSSQKHVSMDSGTAWLSAALGIDTIVISKNSYYWHEAYYYMRYLSIQKSVQNIYPKIKIATEEEFNNALLNNNVSEPYSYETYLNKTKKL